MRLAVYRANRRCESLFERPPNLCVTEYRMQLEHAEHTLETIRTLMERSQRYQHLSGYSGLVAGSLVLAGCGALANGWTPVSFAVVWTTVFALAFATNAALTANRARQRGEPVWSRQARTVTLAL